MGKKLDNTLAILNGLVGDYLATSGNALATEMAFFHAEHSLPVTAAGLRGPHSALTRKPAVFLHGIMCTETSWRMPDGTDFGSRLAADCGFTPYYVRYNSGLPIVDNGAALSRLLTEFVAAYPEPIDELLLVGYSMGGLVARSACHRAAEDASPWLRCVRRAIYIGTPHTGAPAERVGRVVAKVLSAIPDPYTRLIADIGNLRSAGMKDLGDADLRAQDRDDQAHRISLLDARHPVPLLGSIRHHLVAGTLSDDPYLSAWFGDSLVPVHSATAEKARDSQGGAIQADDIKVFVGRAHVALQTDLDVYEQIKAWCLKES